MEMISVIVPVYKVEKYLHKCIDSIRNQTYTNLEIILVDDGSPDNCGKICDEYATLDDRIIVIHKENGGLADARNFGIDKATGQYLSFVDSDDYIHPQMYERMMQAMTQSDADIVISDLNMIPEAKEVEFPKLEGNVNLQILNRHDIQNRYFENTPESIYFTVAWNKLYKRKCFKTYRYPHGRLHEDEFVTFKTLYEADNVVAIEDKLYYYVSREASITADFNVRRFDLFDAYEEKIRYFAAHNEWYFAKRYFMQSLHMIVQYDEWIDYKNAKQKDAIIRYKSNIVDLASVFGDNLRLSRKEKFEVTMCKYCFALYRRSLKFKRRWEKLWYR